MTNKLQGPLGTSSNAPVIDGGTLCLAASSAPVPSGVDGKGAMLDELTPIAEYMANEINTNTRGAKVAEMARMNAFSATECITNFTSLPFWKQILGLGIDPRQCVNLQMTQNNAALLTWATQVRQFGPWDHKPIIANRFNGRRRGRTPQTWHRYGSTEYFYDVWSNLHYGYVGTAAGFSESVLLDGAGMEQFVSTLVVYRTMPTKTPGVDGARAWDDAFDRSAIANGIALYRRNPTFVTSRELLNLVLCGTVLTRPVAQ